MDANDTTPAQGESASGESFEQKCLCCEATFAYSGEIRTEVEAECPECGFSVLPRYFWYWAISDDVSPVETEVRVPRPVIEAAEFAVSELGYSSRSDFILDQLDLRFVFVEDGGEPLRDVVDDDRPLEEIGE